MPADAPPPDTPESDDDANERAKTCMRLIANGLAYHRAGRIDLAAHAYSSAVRTDSSNPDAVHLFGAVLHDMGRSTEALTVVNRAIELRAETSSYHSTKAVILQSLGRFPEALAAAKDSLRRNPGMADVWFYKAKIRADIDRRDHATDDLRRVVLLDPVNELASASLAGTAKTRGAYQTAIPAFRRLLCAHPLSSRARADLAGMLMEVGREQQARDHLVRSVAVDPGHVDSRTALGFVQLGLNAFASAERSFQQALSIEPAFHAPMMGLAECAYLQNNVEDAVQWSARGVAHAKADPQPRYRHSIHLAAAGRIAESLDYGAWKFRKADAVHRVGVPPRWEGEPLSGKSLVICSEEGVGDEIAFAATIPDLAAQADRLFIDCDARLVDVYRRSFPGAVIEPHQRTGTRLRPTQSYDWLPDDPAPDYHVDIGDIPRFTRRTLEDWDRGDPYLTADPDRVASWRERLAGLDGNLKVAFSWRSRVRDWMRNNHYTELDDWRPLFALEGVSFISMQYGDDWRPEIDPWLGSTVAPIHCFDDTDMTNDFEAIFALAVAVDLVICPSSTLAWAGASVGTPTWMFYLKPFYPAYGLERVPGYPALSMFGKQVTEPWSGVFKSLAGALQEKIDQREPQS